MEQAVASGQEDCVRRVRRTQHRRRAGLPWTAREEESLARLFPITDTKDLAARFGRSWWAILGKARSLGLSREPHDECRRRREGRRWSPDEIERLRTLYRILPYEDVADEIGRSHDAVKMKARRLRLRKMEEWSPAEDELLRGSYQDQSYERMAERLDRTVSAVKTRVAILGLEPKVQNWTENEVRLLKDRYRTGELDAIAAMLGRTRAATAKKAREMGLVRHRHWLPEDVRTLRELYSCHPVRDLAGRFRRSCATVRHKASRLGLHRQWRPVESGGTALRDTRETAEAMGGNASVLLSQS
ncbi:MAG: hypothetical protein ACM3VT_13940 [Solirubrobacterales bacterium]